MSISMSQSTRWYKSFDDFGIEFEKSLHNLLRATSFPHARLANDESVSVYSNGRLLTWNGEELIQLTLEREAVFRIEIHLASPGCAYSTLVEAFGDIAEAEAALVLVQLNGGETVHDNTPDEESR
ncbi:MAG: hypothetical protein JHD15_17115 [Phenylobacterium sp.]|uniref:hypothetical protein n=1 Tax=Phenylobacterium sp. TaxID=1871053 RepID=UPI001A348BFD|nr:hypothetical protein [Phenylobacterium sp.]MBJ7412067.1 hypothetical protein [Phenylobacterium sp.]